MARPELLDACRVPVIAAPMFLVSGPDLVVASCKAGVVGTFPALNQRTTEGFEQWVIQIKEALADAPNKAFGVNLIVHRTNPRVQADLEICVKHEVPLIITSLGAVSELVDTVHGYGGLVYHDVTNRRHAQKAIDAGVDGLILVSAGAGGHAGTINPFAFVKHIRPMFDGTIILAGSISTGGDVAAAMAMGADVAYMGTRFIATTESAAQDEYKQMVCDTNAEEIVYTPAVSGVNANFMRPSLEDNGFDMEQLLNPGSVDFGHKLTMSEEAKAWKTVWSAGHGVSSIDDVPTTAELVERIVAEYEAARGAL